MKKLGVFILVLCLPLIGCEKQTHKTVSLNDKTEDQIHSSLSAENDEMNNIDDINTELNNDDQVFIDEHVAMNSLDYEGLYENTIKIENQMRKVTIDLGEDIYFITIIDPQTNDVIEEHEGSYAWNAEGNSITLSDEPEERNHYFVAEGALLLVSPNSKNPLIDATEKWIKVQ